MSQRTALAASLIVTLLLVASVIVGRDRFLSAATEDSGAVWEDGVAAVDQAAEPPVAPVFSADVAPQGDGGIGAVAVQTTRPVAVVDGQVEPARAATAREQPATERRRDAQRRPRGDRREDRSPARWSDEDDMHEDDKHGDSGDEEHEDDDDSHVYIASEGDERDDD
jgi:hypothetical protein